MSFTLAQPVYSELVIKKSRFIGCVQPVADRAAALTVVASLRAEHPAAAHVCWALMAGGQSAANDDGEPGGTAGRPMLEVLRHQQIEGSLATVVRYFGGVKLGAGGLVRAYTDSIAQALLGATLVPLVRQRGLRCAVPYSLEGLVRRELTAVGAVLEAVQHGNDVLFAFTLPEPEANAFIARLDDAAQGRVVWQPA
ncbi:IMPACT family protein [Variovorax boronicumulans]|uniref:IMPACT family protein n=1 Tax=Variovorax boronicumulans TaxID=436515 RepID=UPI00278013A2|nr:YigZ family protein [Variovorax boronicumulans]MDQ0043291.1 putative YigZ family protein [Variovorax boronicumulans]